jgi:hypothetical protein
MTRRGEGRRRPGPAVAAALACALAGASAQAGSLTVRDGQNAWTVTDDPQPDASDFVLRHLVGGTRIDERFGRNGQIPFSLNAGNDPPASVRVDAEHRTWMVGAALAGNQPQPVVARFLADGNPDLRWGVQGKLQLTPAGVVIKPNDLLPLADGSVLVAGEVLSGTISHAAVFHLGANGALDRGFGNGGVWQRPGDGDNSTATSLAASGNGLVAVAVAVRGAKPQAEAWSLTDVAQAVLQRQPLDDTADAEDLRVDWSADRWVLVNGGGPTAVVPPALLTNRPQGAAAPVAASDPGGGGFSPFVAEAASAATPTTPEDDGLPWPWIAAALVLLAAIAAAFVMRSRRPQETPRKPGR